ncbi:hypothetical protein HPB47_025941 [Ixodes persulcatus]|uniref:Uncharacterized protein n=1 Tax=Ixodes persulcatus TaxID=34615 RepID=A0AC60Q042_IXOPE|nr:hypothetical protein HPB47_025941 [Ixodes persulcatus]
MRLQSRLEPQVEEGPQHTLTCTLCSWRVRPAFELDDIEWPLAGSYYCQVRAGPGKEEDSSLTTQPRRKRVRVLGQKFFEPNATFVSDEREPTSDQDHPDFVPTVFVHKAPAKRSSEARYTRATQQKGIGDKTAVL